MDRSIPTGELGKLVGCKVKGPIEVPEGAVNKRCLSMRDFLDNVPVWSPKGRVIDGIDHCEIITFKVTLEQAKYLAPLLTPSPNQLCSRIEGACKRQQLFGLCSL